MQEIGLGYNVPPGAREASDTALVKLSSDSISPVLTRTAVCGD